MNKKQAEEVLRDYTQLRRELKELQLKADAECINFYKACDILEADGYENQYAKIIKSKTPGIYQYPPKITKLEDQVKELKTEFKLKHEPIAGGQIIWQVKVKE